MPTIRTTLEIHAPIQRCFDLARSIDFHMHSMAATGERAIAGVTGGLISEGQEVTWRARHLGMTRELTSRITRCDRPHVFIDEQVRGSFKRFRHEHRFESFAPDRTRATDTFEFEPPLRLLGHAANALFLTRYMTGLLRRHAVHLKAALESEQWRRFLPSEPGCDIVDQ
jgi:ligand-binding SRPBCC domain-containing protein